VFDFRYHVVSLAAVFLALVLGILVGVAISDPGLADRTDKQNLRDEIARLEDRLDAAQSREDSDAAAAAFAERAYDAVMDGRLRDVTVAVLVIGPPDDDVVADVEDAISDAGGSLLRLRAIRVPVPDDLADGSTPAELGRRLGEEFVDGGETPAWDDLSSELVLERVRDLEEPADAVVVVRTAQPQREDTARLLRGIYDGLEGSVPAVGVERSRADASAVDAFRRAELSVVDNVDMFVGRISLAVVLAGSAEGHFGLKPGAEAPVPPIEPVPPPSEETSG
jgi:hypothetical protein